MSDVNYMRMALDLARRGAGWVNPNPMVGCVVVKDGRIIGQGWHERFGQAHAERNALASCTEDPRGATLYVTLEPCCHTGHQPPCTEAVIGSGIARAVVGSSDPNPLVAGRGVAALRAAGIRVDVGVEAAACDRLNEAFFHYITSGMPFVTLKYAMTMDGKVATRTGASQWVTGEAARARTRADRGRVSAIMVGVGTVLADDPLLTCRTPGAHEPVRVICDSHLRTPLTSRLVATARETPVLVACADAPSTREEALTAAGVTVVRLPGADGRVDLAALMRELAARELSSVLVEGGPTLAAGMLEAGLVQRVQAYVAPLVFGGVGAPSPLAGVGVATPAEAVRLGSPTVRRFGEDLLVECDVLPADNAAKATPVACAGRGR